MRSSWDESAAEHLALMEVAAKPKGFSGLRWLHFHYICPQLLLAMTGGAPQYTLYIMTLLGLSFPTGRSSQPELQDAVTPCTHSYAPFPAHILAWHLPWTLNSHAASKSLLSTSDLKHTSFPMLRKRGSGCGQRPLSPPRSRALWQVTARVGPHRFATRKLSPPRDRAVPCAPHAVTAQCHTCW